MSSKPSPPKAVANSQTRGVSRGLSLPLIAFCGLVLVLTIYLAQPRGSYLLDTFRRYDFWSRAGEGVREVSVLKLLAEGQMDWERSTTPIPISAVSYVVKNMLGGRWDEVPEQLRKLEGDTVMVAKVREYFYEERLRHVRDVCEREDVECSWRERDGVYGLTALHLANYGSDDRLVDYLRGIGVVDEIEDEYGRLAKNLSFTAFMRNAREAAKQRGSECEIPEVEIDGSREAWEEVKRLVGEGEPIMMRNAGTVLDKNFITEWNVDKFVRDFGEEDVRVGSVPYSKVFGIQEDSMKLSEFWEQYGGHGTEGKDSLYVFQQNMAVCDKGWELLKKLVHVSFPTPELIEDPEKAGKESIQFFFGMMGSGAPFHIHADAINFVVSGEKRWFIQTPRMTMYSRKPAKQWVEEDLQTLNGPDRPLECLQRAGDIVYVPMDWGHAVLNIKDNTFGYAMELLNKRDTFSHLAPRKKLK